MGHGEQNPLKIVSSAGVVTTVNGELGDLISENIDDSLALGNIMHSAVKAGEAAHVIAETVSSNQDESSDEIGKIAGMASRFVAKASERAASSALEIQNLREANYGTVDFSSVGTKTDGGEKFDTENLMANYETLKGISDEFAGYNKSARKLIYEKITSNPIESVLYGEVAVSAMTSWDNNITAADNVDEMVESVAVEVAVAEETAVNLNNELEEEFRTQR